MRLLRPFLAATVGAYGEDGYLDYWTSLKDNGVKISDSWSDAYYVDFSGGGEGGPRPVVLSYGSSPAYTLDGDESTTSSLPATCFRQVEYAGVIAGSDNPAAAGALVDYMLSADFQAALPLMIKEQVQNLGVTHSFTGGAQTNYAPARMWGAALTLIVIGLLSSTLHLRHPERAWRAISQWRSSWL